MPRSNPPRRRATASRESVAESLEPRRLMAAGTIAFGAARYDVGEGAGSVSFTITRTGGTDPITATYKLFGGQFFVDSATPGEDFGDVSGTVAFAEGETLKTIEVPITDDTQAEGNEHIIINFTASTGGATTGTPNQVRVYILGAGERGRDPLPRYCSRR